MANQRSRKRADKMPGKVRIIAGQWRHRQLSVLPRTGLRPTPDRVRETLFNWLGLDVHGATCLDLFAGSGALGFEAASRGAAKVTLVERDPALAEHLRMQAHALGANTVQVVCADATQWLVQDSASFDLAFIDPPYGSMDLPLLMQALQRHGRVNAASRVYVETAVSDARPVFPNDWLVLRDKRAAGVRYYLATPAVD